MLEARANVRESKRRNANVGIPENWTAARAALLRAWNRAPDRPEAAVQLQEAAMWGGAGDPELWFARAVHLEADIPLAYHYQWHYAYLPKWGGSREKLLAFAEACRATGRHDTMIPAQAYALLNEVRRLEGREDRTRHLLVEPPERLAMVEEVLAPLATNENATISFRAFGVDDLPLLLLWGGEPEKAADAYARTRPLWREPMARQFADFPVEERALRGLCGPHRAELCAMERAFHARNWTDVLARAEALRALPDLAPEERESLEARLVEASLRSVYARGEWVDVGQHPSGAGWKAFAAAGWEPAPDGGYRHGPFAPDAAAGLERGKLRWTGWNAPPRFDVETTVRFDPAANATNRWFALCPDEKAIDREKVGVPVLRLEADGPWLVVRFDSEKDLLSGEAEELARVPFAEGEPVRLALRGRFMFLDVEINGKTVLGSFKPKGWNYPRDERRRLWVAASGAAFSDMRVRAVKPSARVPDLGFPLPPNVRASRWICGEYSVDLDEPSPDAAAKDAAPAP